MTIEEVLDFFDNAKITKKLQQLVDVGLSYMTLGQSLTALSGGEIQRIKLAQALNKKGNICIRWADDRIAPVRYNEIDEII